MSFAKDVGKQLHGSRGMGTSERDRESPEHGGSVPRLWPVAKKKIEGRKGKEK